MATTARQVARVTTARPVKKLQKPRPLKAQTIAKHAAVDNSMGVFEEIMTLADNVANNLANGNIDRSLQSNIISLNNMLKSYGENLEVIYKGGTIICLLRKQGIILFIYLLLQIN